MESSEHKKGFENFLKEKADSYKMYPSEKVWTRLNDQLHPRKKWPYLAMAVIFLGLGFGGKIYDSKYSVQHPGLISSSQSAHDDVPAADSRNETISAGQALVIDLYPGVTAKTARQKATFNEPAQNTVNSSMETRSLVYTSPVEHEAGHFSNSFTEKLNSPIGDDLKYLPGNLADNTLAPVIIISEQGTTTSSKTIPDANSASKAGFIISAGKSSDLKHNSTSLTRTNSTKSNPGNSDLLQQSTNSLSASTASMNNSFAAKNEAQHSTTENKATAIRVKKPGKDRLGWQLYFSPTISYRSLYGTINKNSYSNMMLFSSLPGSPKDVNSAVSQSPSIGMELGTAMVYSIGKNLRIKGGLQFNYSQYNINAFQYAPEIAPLSAAGIGHTEIKAITNLRNFDGYSTTQLRNEHFSISMPIGADLVVIGNKDIAFNIGGSIQPGIMLNNQAYLLSTNLRNYAKAPSLYRDFNINTALEAFISINTGSLKWNVGPQFRYQLLSSYKQNYPIKEHLYDYGFKVGMTKTLR
jgi:hypothetical protein